MRERERESEHRFKKELIKKKEVFPLFTRHREKIHWVTLYAAHAAETKKKHAN